MQFIKTLFQTDSSNISAVEANERIANGATVVDVRQQQEYVDGHIKGAKLIPLNELSSRMNELPKDRELVIVCRSGSRSSVATRQLNGAGYNAVNLSGGMIAWSGARLPIKRGR
ncbi:MAG: rhodanese-like domain-containing protein [Chloroflexi bacterium]|nr:rhodanese-like domain-containing protein [Chloroflexota bacterium]